MRNSNSSVGSAVSAAACLVGLGACRRSPVRASTGGHDGRVNLDAVERFFTKSLEIEFVFDTEVSGDLKRTNICMACYGCACASSRSSWARRRKAAIGSSSSPTQGSPVFMWISHSNDGLVSAMPSACRTWMCVCVVRENNATLRLRAARTCFLNQQAGCR